MMVTVDNSLVTNGKSKSCVFVLIIWLSLVATSDTIEGLGEKS
jgi:hypothetical protein